MKDKSIGPLQDVQQAIKIVRQHFTEWNIDTEKVGIMGFSAGGHLASTAGTHFDSSFINNKEHVNLRPDFMILIYPVISMTNKFVHAGSRDNLLGSNASVEKIIFFNLIKLFSCIAIAHSYYKAIIVVIRILFVMLLFTNITTFIF